MLNNENDIEQLFRDRFENAEVAPADDIWAKLESNINKRDIEGLYQTAFKNAAVEPAASVWQKIASTLAWRSFLTFKFNTFNVYYATLVTAILSFTAFNFFQKDSESTSVSDAQLAETTEQITERTENNISLADNSVENTNDVLSSTSTERSAQSAENNSTNAMTVVAVNANSFSETADNPKNRKKNDSERLVDWSFVKITGRNSICKDIPSVYGVEGLNEHAEVNWILPKSAKKNSAAGHNISLIWQEAGQQTLSVVVKINDEKNTLNYNVDVEGVAVPNIKGKTKVCQGMEKQLYYVDETINKEISYLWEAQQNAIDLIGNKYINVDWTKSGKDTLSVTKINNVTGCKSYATVGIVIYPQPKIDFEYYPLGENQYEFAFTETQRKGYSYEWSIEGVEYNEPVVTHEASGTGSSFASLMVTDKNGCVSKIQKEIDFNKNFLAVPSKFNPANGNYFMPLTNANLQSYRMEIYNARNEKIWESTELSDGKPANGWDGKFRGTSLPRGKYMWKITATFEDGTQWKGVTQPNGSCRPNGIFVLEN
ncbi:MAG: hypothetical protein IKP08_02900 [Bacteroidales bacterium]|nr:hypothetical protein [Bacteroidales bacterium]